MSIQILTKDDLSNFKNELLESIKEIILENKKGINKKWLKSGEVCKLLNISNGTLGTLRTDREIPFTMMGKSYYYAIEDIEKILAKNKNK